MTVLHFVYLAASDGEETIWAQMLVVVMVAAGGGIYTFIKARPGSGLGKTRVAAANHSIINRGITRVTHFLQTAGGQITSAQPALPQKSGGYLVINQTSNINYQVPAVIEAVISPDTQRNKKPFSATPLSAGPAPGRDGLRHSTANNRNLKNGMELLENGFLVKVIERPVEAAGLDIEMKKMCFAELMRRRELAAISSEALKAYTLDGAGLYGKIIQRQAMEELFQRTGEKDS